MPISDEERRRRDRERKRQKRAGERGTETGDKIPRIGLGVADTPRTNEAPEDAPETPDESTSNAAAARALIADLEVPARVKPLVPVLYRLATDLDGMFNVPQRASITTKYLEVLDRILEAARPVERDELDEMRKAFYLGEVPGGEHHDPEGPAEDDKPKRSRQRRKA